MPIEYYVKVSLGDTCFQWREGDWVGKWSMCGWQWRWWCGISGLWPSYPADWMPCGGVPHMPSIQTESRSSMQEDMWLWVGNGKVKVLVRIRMLQRYKENVEEQKKKQCWLKGSSALKPREVKRLRGFWSQKLRLIQPGVSIPPQIVLSRPLLPVHIEEVGQDSHDCSMQTALTSYFSRSRLD